MAIQIKTERYEFAHGKAPKGTGGWAFEGEMFDKPVFAPAFMSYREACAWVRQIVRRTHQDATIHVAS
ncbi:hypothetical protein CC53_gp098 [Rhizobium phage vB_RleS_L338C]|uniref:hypothetical protein n=1 Tax=Rhizobium phage vB_RleS_L338C TaxID=1414737 RepID=UPI0003D95BD2|nr:hypothetical protein CC53_gp098 [Rhizobium phage vB_RleS_L338C]AHC30515.1 hypothetical protein L338C_098 [Rhizobium phage vB_RleS_L338C]QNH72180.1 hypothetical protein P11VFA_052 [Rhizobium phage P11VFA]